jgi:cytochrome c
MFMVLLMSAVPATAAGDPKRGERLFQRCYACHSVNPADKDLPGPNLHAVIGRPAGSVPGFDYSPAFRARARQGLVWSEPQLEAFLADPQALIPKNRMSFFGLKSAEDRRDLIAYLKKSGL